MEQVVGILKFGKKDKITMHSETFFLLFYIDNFFDNVYTQEKISYATLNAILNAVRIYLCCLCLEGVFSNGEGCLQRQWVYL